MTAVECMPRKSRCVVPRYAPSALFFRVVSLSGLHDEVFVGGGQTDLVIADAGDSFIGGVAQVVLVAQLLFDLGVDLADRLFLGHFKETSAGFPRDLLQNLLAVGMRLLLGISSASGTAAPAASPWDTPTAGPAHASAAHATVIAALVAVSFRIGIQDGVDQSVGALGRLDGPRQCD